MSNITDRKAELANLETQLEECNTSNVFLNMDMAALKRKAHEITEQIRHLRKQQ